MDFTALGYDELPILLTKKLATDRCSWAITVRDHFDEIIAGTNDEPVWVHEATDNDDDVLVVSFVDPDSVWRVEPEHLATIDWNDVGKVEL